MIVYAVDAGKYITVKEALERRPGEKLSVYVNLTNRCNCSCTFCLRPLKEMAEGSSLWLDEEPDEEEVWAGLSALPWDRVGEVVFCGFGEPTMRLDALVSLLRRIRDERPGTRTRLNTNGLSDLEYGRDTSADFDGLLDTISISLNASNAERYIKLTQNKFGVGSFEAMLAFAGRAKAHVPNVVLTVVERVEDEEEISRCRELCEERGLRLRVRRYEGS